MILDRTPYDEEYIPSQEAIKFFVWMNTFFKEENKPAEAHFQLIDHILSLHTLKGIQASRGLSKTTLAIAYAILYYAYLGRKPGFGIVNYAMVVSDSLAQVKSIFEQILSLVEDNDKLKDHLSVIKSRSGDDPYIEFINKSGDIMRVRGRGAGQRVRGVKAGKYRPNLILVDDLENDENIESKDAREKLKSWFLNALMPSIDPNRYEITMIGTPLHEDSVLSMITESSKWKVIMLPACEEYPPKPGKKIVSAWSDRFTPEFLKHTVEQYEEAGRKNSFFQEYMLETVNKENMLFDLDTLNYWSEDEYEAKIKGLSYYISVDLAISEKSYADYTAITVVGVNRLNHWFVLHMDYGRYSPDKTIQKIMSLARMYYNSTLVIEKGTLFLGIKKALQNEMLQSNTFFNIKEVTRGTSKLSVIKTLEPRMNVGKLWLPKNAYKKQVEELKYQMSMVTNDSIKAKHDDLLDTLAQLGLVDLVGSDIMSPESSLKGYKYVNPYI